MKAPLLFWLLLLSPMSALTGLAQQIHDTNRSDGTAALEPYTLDLALPVAKRAVEANDTLLFRITNQLPGRRYRYRTRKSQIVLPPLTLPAGDGPAEVLFGLHTDSTPCSVERARLDSLLYAATTELELLSVPLWIGGRRPACQDSLRAAFEALTTREPFPAETLKRGQTLEIVVERVAAGGEVEFRQSFFFSTGPPGTWQTSFGFGFVPRRGDEVFTRPAEVDSLGFDIVEADPSNGLDFLPTITFTWLPPDRGSRRPTFSAGIGSDLEEVTLFAGAGYLVGQNVGLHLGLAVHRVDRRRARYRGVETVREALAPDQLTEKVFAPNLLLGVSFRLGTDPFQRDGTAPAQPSEPPP